MMMRPAWDHSIESGLEKTRITNLLILILTVNTKIHPSQLIAPPFGGKVRNNPKQIIDKLKLIEITKINTVSSGRDQVSFQDIQTHLFGVKTESLQKLPSKVNSVIAGSFHQLLLLPLSHQEFTVSSRIPNILLMVLSKCISTSEEKELVLSLMIESQFLTLVPIMSLNTLQSTPNHLQQEPGGWFSLKKLSLKSMLTTPILTPELQVKLSELSLVCQSLPINPIKFLMTNFGLW